MCMKVSKVGLKKKKKKPARPETINVMQLDGCFDFVPGICIWLRYRDTCVCQLAVHHRVM